MKKKTLSFDEDLFLDIQDIAEQEHRNVSAQIRHMCAYYIKYRQKSDRIVMQEEENA